MRHSGLVAPVAVPPATLPMPKATAVQNLITYPG